jgi:hypothetical protein
MGDDEATGYIGGAVTPEMQEAVDEAVDWAGTTASAAIDWAAQEVKDVGDTISEGIDTAEKWVSEHKDDLLM